jgi:hypothetical protein
MVDNEPSDNRRELLLKRLHEAARSDPEEGHIAADEALLDYIGDPEITQAFESIGKWYA